MRSFGRCIWLCGWLLQRLNNEKMPLVLDDVIDVTDESQLTGVLKAMSMVNTEQTILLTSDKDLVNRLEDMHIACNVVTL